MTQGQIVAIGAAAYLLVAVGMIRYIYVQVIDLNVERGREAKLTAVVSGTLWPAMLVILAMWHLSNSLLFRETPGQRKARQKLERQFLDAVADGRTKVLDD